MNGRRRLIAAGTALACAHVAAAAADVTLASPFTSHVVLQRDVSIPVWGEAAPGERVTVTFAGQNKSAVAGTDGRWRVTLGSLAASAKPRVMVATGSATATPLTIEDVVVGEVWLASGQSNMDFTVAKTEKYYFAGVDNEAKEVAAADDPGLRMFTGDWARAYEPQTRVPGMWKRCTPENVREFSAVAYFFARDLRRALRVPVGIITLTYGASTPQAWIRREAIAADPQLKTILDGFDAAVTAFRSDPTVAAKHADALKEWEAAAAKAKQSGDRPPRRPRDPDPVQDQHNPTVMYNGMVAPVVPFALRGFLWYQGESITGPKELFPRWNEALIRDWRTLWNGDRPFYFCQLAAYPKDSHSPEVRGWQAEALRLPNTGMAVTIDIGDEKDVHPHNKQDVGARLARIALARTYDQEIEHAGPQFRSMKTKGDKVHLTFDHVGQGLVAKDGPLRTFEVAGADGRFVPAEAVIVGRSIVVRSPEVPVPASVRYAWSSYPVGCNLYNSDGLPAAPFRAAASR